MKPWFFVADGKSVSAHGGEAFHEFLLHRADGGSDTDEGHDSKGDDCYCEARAQFVCLHCSKRQQ